MEITLETPRLLLRRMRGSDLDAWARMTADAEVMKYIGTGVTFNRNEAWRSIAGVLGHWQLLGYGMWAVACKEDDELVARVGFFDPPGWPGFELGWIVGREHWGKGYATEAARVALDYAFTALKRDRVVSLIRYGNERSVRVAEKIGERYSGDVELLGSMARVYEITR